MDKYPPIFWLTGMSGSGKTTLTNAAVDQLTMDGVKTLILDGDIVRDRYKTKLSFSRKDIEKNNMNVSRYCSDERNNYDCIIVPIISPYDSIRKKIRQTLSPNFYLVYVSTSIKELKNRDTKGLYAKTDNGEIDNLIGYSESSPYTPPSDFDCNIDTSNPAVEIQSIELFYNFIKKKIMESKVI